ncbi:Phage-related protein [Brachyspira pilosicoli]|uniref:hypothetical protein n=1 Tax=Brachyspira pilosicoli TaxID=52584 RepID=UPI000E182A5A|nr:hypothetical protein [Brachyspira pilosicoli]SUW09027.1 Phage-related protein [Brachyspira pilosicoli]
MSEVYQVAFDLSALEKAFKLSEKIKNNLSGFQGFSNRTSKKDSSDFSQNIIDSNKGLKEQNKLLGVSLQKLNLMRLVSSKIKWGALAVAGLPIAGITAGIASMNGTLATNTRAKNTGLTFGESNALNFAGKMTGLGEDTLISSIEGLTTSLQDYSKWGNFASLGLNARDLQNKNPVEALFSVLDSMKDNNLPQYIKKQIIDNLGIPFDNFKFVLKEGTEEIEKYFKEGIGMFGDKNGKSLMSGERALIRFTTVLKDISQNIGGKISPTLTTSLKLVTPYIYKLADSFTWLLGKVFTKRNLDMISGVFNYIGKIGNDFINKGIDLFNSGKSLFSEIFKGFSIDKEGWITVLKDFGKSFLDIMGNLWNILKPNLITIGESLVDVWKTIEPDLLTLLEFWKTNILPPLQSIFGSSVNILGKIIKKIIDDFKWFYNFIRPIFKPLGKLFSSVFNTVSGILGGIDKGSNIGGIMNTLSNLSTPISALKTIIETTTSVLNVFKTKITETWQSIKDSFTKVWLTIDMGIDGFISGLMGIKIGKGTIGGILGYSGPKYKAENGWWKIKDEKGNYQYLGKNGGISQYPEKRVNDAIITKTGQIVKTDPQDYIFAMKQPQKLASASVSGGGTYTININANVRNDNDIRQIKNELERLIKSFNSKR